MRAWPPIAFALIGCGRVGFDAVVDARNQSVDAPAAIPGLIHWWKLDETPAATVLVDSAGTANIPRAAGTGTFGAGKDGNALFIPDDGTETDTTIATPTDMLGKTALSLSYWNQRLSFEGAVGQDIGGTSSTRISIAPWDDGRVYFSISDGGTDSAGYVLLSDTSWHMYTLVFDGSGTGNANRLQGYVDGTPQTLTFQGTIPSATTSTRTSFKIGDGLSNQTQFAGYYDDIRIYDHALSPSDVATLYASTGGM